MSENCSSLELGTIICPASAKHCRQSEASILALNDGRLLLAYTDFYGGNWHDEGSARIMGKTSLNEGETWSDSFVIQENIGKNNVMGASLLLLSSGRILLSFMCKDSEPTQIHCGVLHSYLIHSDDNGASWSEPIKMTSGDRYWCSANDRLIQLKSGRILLPSGDGETGNLCCWLSDDSGNSWKKSKESILNDEDKRFAEPCLVELSSGELAMFIRTNTKNIHIAYSNDEGDSWELRNSWAPFSCESPCMVRRLPDSKDLLLIWNNSGIRNNFTAAISSDDGLNWQNYRLLEEQETWPMTRSHAYPSLVFHNQYAHISYWETHNYGKNHRLFHLIYRRLPIEWFYEKKTRRLPAYNPSTEELSAKAIYNGEENI